MVDPTALTGHDYEVYFWDTSNDGIDNNNNWTLANDVGADGIAGTGDEGEGDNKPTLGEPNLDSKDPKELESITTRYAVKDLYEYTDEFTPKDTFFVSLDRKNLAREGIVVQDALSNVVPDSLYEIDYANGAIRAAYPGALNSGIHTIRYEYHPVYFSDQIQGNPNTDLVIDSDIFDGLSLVFDNKWKTEADTAGSGWNDKQINFDYDIAFENAVNPSTGKVYKPVFFPSNYEIRISDHVVDTTSDFFQIPQFPPTPRKFEIINTTGNYKIEYVHNDANHDQYPSLLERIIFLEKDPEGNFTIYTWQFQLLRSDTTQLYQFHGGEVLNLVAKFPFNKFDLFKIKTEVPEIVQSKAKDNLDRIKVVPNPYIVAHEFEPPLPPGVTSGRGERLIYFTHLPVDSKVHIFTARGEHIITLEGDNSMFNGTITWNLKTKENLDIAYGVYFYVVESPVGTKRGKFAVIK